MSTLLDTKTEVTNYSDLYRELKRLFGNIKDNANVDYFYSSTKDYDNSKKFFNNICNVLFNITSSPDISGVYPKSSELPVIDSYGNTGTRLSMHHFKNILENCFNLKIDQSIYVSAETKHHNSKLDPLNPTGSSSSKQHLLYYNKITNNNTQNFDEKSVKLIYSTIFLLDVYINIVEAFLSINLNEDKERNRNMWDNTLVKVMLESDYTSNYPENNEFVRYSELIQNTASIKNIKNYKDIHIVCNQLYSNALPQGMFINKEVSGSEHRQCNNGVYLYIGDKFKKQGTNSYFNEIDTSARKINRPSSDSTTRTSKNSEISTTFVDRYGILHDGIVSANDGKYTYGFVEYSFNNETTGNYTDAKKPYQKLIRMFLIMIRNIQFDNLGITLEYLKFYLHSLKTFLLSSINAINIYHNLAWSLTNCLVLNYPDYKKGKFIKYISDSEVNLSDTILSLEINYANLNTSYYTNTDNFVYYIKSKDVIAATGANFKTALDNNINSIENEINKINEVIPIKNRYNYATDPIELIFTNFNFNSINKKISGDTSMTIAKGKLLNDQFNTKKNYLLFIPDYNIKSRIKDISISKTGQPEILLEDHTEHDADLRTGTTTNNEIYTHANKSVYLFAIGISELEDKNYNLSNNINNFENNINYNKTKILNNKSIYDANKSKNIILYYELLIYTLIIIFIIFTLIIINIAKVEIGLMKLISLICFGTLIILLSLYYIINTLYIDESYIETFTTVATQTYTNTLCPTNCVNPIKTGITANQKQENDNMFTENKKLYVKNMLTSNATNLINLTKLSYTYSDTQTLFNKEYELNSLITHRYNDKNYVNSFLENKTNDANINTDLIKYENANYNVTLFSIILLGIIIVSFYNINLFTNNKYMGLLFLIAIILIIILFTYYLININKIVRTISSNYYWGKEFEKTYESFENQENSNSGIQVSCDLPVLKNNRLYFNCGNTQTETTSTKQTGSGESFSESSSGSGSSSGNMQQNMGSSTTNTKKNMMELIS